MTEAMIKRLANGDIAPNFLHDLVSGNDVTRVRKDMGLAPNGLPAIGSKVKVTVKSIWITIKVKEPHPTKPKKTIWVEKTVLSYRKFTSFGHCCPVDVQNAEHMQDDVSYEAVVTKVSRLTNRLPTLSLAVIY